MAPAVVAPTEVPRSDLCSSYSREYLHGSFRLAPGVWSLPRGFSFAGTGGTEDMFDCESAMREVAASYTGLPIRTRTGVDVELRNLLLLGTDDLKAAHRLLTSFEDEAGAVDQLERMRTLVVLLASDREEIEREVDDWPLGMYMSVLEAWREVTESGEAQGSES